MFSRKRITDPVESMDYTIEQGQTLPAVRSSPSRDLVEVGVFLIVLAVSIVVEFFVEPNTTADRVQQYAGVFGMLAVVTVLHLRRHEPWGAIGWARPRSWWKTIALAAPLTIGVMMIVFAAQLYVISPLVQGQAADISRFDELRGNLPRLLFSLSSVWVTAGFIEEVVYRGFLMNRLASIMGGSKGAWAGSLVLSSAIFGSIHLYQGLPGVLLTGLMGLLLGGIYLLAGRKIWLGVFVHGLVNTISLTSIYFGVTPG